MKDVKKLLILKEKYVKELTKDLLLLTKKELIPSV